MVIYTFNSKILENITVNVTHSVSAMNYRRLELSSPGIIVAQIEIIVDGNYCR